VQTREPGCSLDKAMRTLGSGRSQGWSGVGRSDLDSKAGSPQARSGYEDLAGPYIPRLVCRQGPPDFESGLAT
jgi:hypothetical protein